MRNIINPYSDVDFAECRRVISMTHEHIGLQARLQSAYNRGLRLFASVWYQPSSPVYPYSNNNHGFLDWLYFDTTHPDNSSETIDVTYNSASEARNSVDYDDVKRKGVIVAYSINGTDKLYTKLIADNWSINDEDWEDVSAASLSDELETYTAYFSRDIPSIDNLNTDTLPQIPNSEKVYLKTSSGWANQHINALGVNSAEAGQFERKGLHRDFRLSHYIYELNEMYDGDVNELRLFFNNKKEYLRKIITDTVIDNIEDF